jgi:hypothetical protein
VRSSGTIPIDVVYNIDQYWALSRMAIYGPEAKYLVHLFRSAEGACFVDNLTKTRLDEEQGLASHNWQTPTLALSPRG